MPDEHHQSALAERVRALAELLSTTDLLRIRVERDGYEVEVGRNQLPASLAPVAIVEGVSAAPSAPASLDVIKADLVGIFHAGRPAPSEGDRLDSDRELAYVEALGIRNPVRSLGAGLIVSVLLADGDPVEYGQPLFEIDRG